VVIFELGMRYYLKVSVGVWFDMCYCAVNICTVSLLNPLFIIQPDCVPRDLGLEKVNTECLVTQQAVYQRHLGFD